ncbi:hypothetical protein Ciccas_002058 [Cichlidogyrus casuarinus]|uniref:Uncharacterized protein n=1 Tax=Cichlidogyrus casuarinus TaxID=1844966 RepID=A0ABD2QIA0_9PLAT
MARGREGKLTVVGFMKKRLQGILVRSGGSVRNCGGDTGIFRRDGDVGSIVGIGRVITPTFALARADHVGVVVWNGGSELMPYLRIQTIFVPGTGSSSLSCGRRLAYR